MMKTKRLFLSFLGLLAAVSLIACARPATETSPTPTPTPKTTATTPAPTPTTKTTTSAPAPTPKVTLPSEVSFALHAVGSGYYARGVAIAKVVTEKAPFKLAAQPFSGPNAWMPILNKGELDTGYLNFIDAAWAYTSGPGFPEKNPNVRLLFRVQYNGDNLGLIVKAASDIKSVKDLKGKRVAGDYAANAISHQEVSAMLASGGLTWNDVKKVPVPNNNEGLKLLRDGQVDACFGGSLTMAGTLETDAAVGIRALSFEVSDEALRKLDGFMPGADVANVKAGAASFIKQDINAIAFWTSIVASAQLSEAAAYEVVKAVYENYKEIQPLHPLLKTLEPEIMLYSKPALPYHPGAIKYYKEKGRWTAELDKLQQELLARK